MDAIQFQTTIGDDGVIRLPSGVSVPPGEAEVTIVPKSPQEPSENPRLRALIDRLAAAGADLNIPADDLPSDLARHHDHYLHGLPKGVDDDE
jgi:hypothetical protein